MTVTCIVQARMGSTRRPGKVLADLGGKPLLGFLLDRLGALDVDHLVVATSDLDRDDPVADLARGRGVNVARGSETDVLDRFVTALDAFPADVVVRLTADCPLSDPELIASAIDLRQETGADYVSNSLIRTFPVGLDVEVMTARALREAAVEATDPAEREHVTPFLYRRPGRYKLVALRTPELLGDEWWTVDTPEDLERVREIVAVLDDPVSSGWREILALAPERGAGDGPGLRLRPAVEGDDDLIPKMTGRPIGNGAPVLPVADRLLDLSIRTWIVTAGGTPVGWAQVVVDDGMGRLSGIVAPECRAQVLSQLRSLLDRDVQVRQMAAGTWSSDGDG